MEYGPMLFEALPQPATLIDAKGIIVDVNAAFLEMARKMGRTLRKEERIGHPIEQFTTTPEGRRRLTGFVRDLLHGGAPQCSFWMFTNAKGEGHPRQLEGHPLREATGQVTGALLLWGDLAAHFQQERQRLCRERLREAFWRLRQEADIPPLLTRLYRELKELFPQLEGCSVQVFQEDTRRWQGYGVNATYAAESMDQWESPGKPVELCWQEQRPVYRPDLMKEDPYHEAELLWGKWNYSGVRAVLDVPFAQGTLAINSRQPQAFDEGEIAALEELAHVLSAGLARLTEVRSQARYRALVDGLPDIVMRFDRQGRHLFVSENVRQMVDLPPARFIGRTHRELGVPEAQCQLWEAVLQDVFDRGAPYETELPFGAGEGRLVYNWRLMPERDAQGAVRSVLSLSRDITERRKLEAQLQQAARLESVGRLAGGVAHDFNNMLGVILGHLEMLMEQVTPGQRLHDDLQEIRQAAERSVRLTRQLLGFARRQTAAPRVLDLNETVESMLSMMRRLIGEQLELVWQPGRGLWPVKVDPAQIDQVLANLCVNARDAIDGVGQVTVETRNASFDARYCAAHPDAAPGEYVMLAVCDNGCGMDEETMAQLFEPFFTTKEVGKGTGLGLATVYGIVRQNRGHIDVSSAPGQGSTFGIYLPRDARESVSEAAEGRPPDLRQGTETILLVEDEPAILKITALMLERLGYRVLAAATPEAALGLARDREEEIHLLITDVVMPGMNGRELADQLRSLCPRLERLFMSGYTADEIADQGVLDEGVYFIQKPFSMKELADKVRGVFDR